MLRACQYMVTAGLLGMTAFAVLVPDASKNDSAVMILAASAVFAVLLLETAARLHRASSGSNTQPEAVHRYRRVA